MMKHVRLTLLARFALLAGLGLLAACTGEFWNQGSGPGASSQVATSRPVRLTPDAAPATEAQVAEAQALLRALGFDPGPVDGKAGSRTASAVKAYQAATGLETDGRVSSSLIERLDAESREGQVTKAQQQLSALGYDPGPADGKAGARTQAAIMAFQVAAGKPRDGKVTPELLAALDAARTQSAGTAGTETAEAESSTTAKVAEASPEPVSEARSETAAGEAAATAAAAATVAGAVAVGTETAASKTEQVGALAPGDRVLLGYLGTKDQPVELQVGDDGRLALPESGSVQAAGMDLSELRDRVTVKLIEIYMGDVDVKVGPAGSDSAATDTAATDTAATDTKVAAGDRLLVSFSGDRAASQEIEVGADGRLGLPDAGAVQAAGLDLAELEEEISVKLLESYMDKLDVRLERAE